MSIRSDSDLGDWRRRVSRSARDIVAAVALTMLALSLIGVAWMRNTNPGPSEPVASAGGKATQQ